MKAGFVKIGLTAALAVALFSGSATTASNECGRIGTWHGMGDQGFAWMAVDSPGQDATNGQISIEWVMIDPTLGGFFPDAARVTNGLGVWKKVNKHVYQYTWIAYGLDQAGIPIYTGRASGTATLTDCDHVDVTYVLELWLAGDDISSDPPFFCAPGTGVETRMSFVQASCPAE